jgi:hypothetical protein
LGICNNFKQQNFNLFSKEKDCTPYGVKKKAKNKTNANEAKQTKQANIGLDFVSLASFGEELTTKKERKRKKSNYSTGVLPFTYFLNCSVPSVAAPLELVLNLSGPVPPSYIPAGGSGFSPHNSHFPASALSNAGLTASNG